LFLQTLATDVRGGAGFVIGFYLLPFIALAPLGLVIFEWARGWSARTIVPAEDRALLTSAAIVGALLAIAPAVSSALFPLDSLTRAQYAGVLPWVLFAFGLGALIVRGLRGDYFPASAVFSTTLAAYVVVGAVAALLPGLPAYHRASGSFVNGAGFALVLAVVPAGVLAMLDRVAADRSRSWVMRALVAAPLVLTVAWLGVSTGARARHVPAEYMRELVLSD
jgi:hypothetical protein